MRELDVLRALRPDAASPDDEARQRSRAVLAEAIRGEQTSPRRRWARWVPAVGLVAAVALALVIGVGSPPSSAPGTDSAPWLLRPQPAGALTQVRPVGEGMVEIRFLHPDADPERIRDELVEHGIAVDVDFVPSDPFTVGTIVVQDVPAAGTPIETLREGDDLTGGGFGHDVGIRVPQGWTGEGHMISIGRAALPGEKFNSTVALNAVRPGGPLHCADVHGMRPEEAAGVVEERGYRVVWRTEVRSLWGGTKTVEKVPPADYWIWDALWHSEDEIMLFADPRQPEPHGPVTAELVSRGCDEAGR